MNGERVGEWRVPGRGPQEFHDDPAWLSSPQFRPLSLSLPVGLGTPALRGEQLVRQPAPRQRGHREAAAAVFLPAGQQCL
jgi:hypothetical protein